MEKITVSIQVSVGELLDKLTILEIKKNALTDQNKLHNVNLEYNLLKKVVLKCISKSPELIVLMDRLKEVNQILWDLENEIRVHEAKNNFDKTFITTARNIYKFNDQRANIKRDIDISVGSKIISEKEYKEY